MTENPYLDGKVLIIDKPLTWTSFDVVKKTKYLIQKKYNLKKLKVGHAGTLDPLATGVLVVCTGKMTKKINEFQATKKEYIAKIAFGGTTPSFDLETEPDVQYPYEHITAEKLKSVVEEQFIGLINQCPPLFSAKQINGVRAYKYARRGEDVEMKPNEVEIYEMELLSDFSEMPILNFRISCSKGTYIRSIAHDLGKALGSGGYLAGLIRTKVGNLYLEDAVKLEDFEKELKELQPIVVAENE